MESGVACVTGKESEINGNGSTGFTMYIKNRSPILLKGCHIWGITNAIYEYHKMQIIKNNNKS